MVDKEMKYFNYLTEAIKEVSWKIPKIGWWLDKDIVTLYHGTHINNIDFIKKNGIVPPKEGYTAGRVYLAFDPYTSRGYSCMSAVGGESQFRSLGTKVKTTPMNERVVFIVKLPIEYVLKYGKINKNSTKEEYIKSKVPDYKFYELWEVSFFGKIDKKYIVAYMKCS